MAKKAKQLTYEDIEDDLELAIQYADEIREIRDKYDFDKKEAFIEKCKSYQKEECFLKKFEGFFRNLLANAENAELDYEFESILDYYGIHYDNDEFRYHYNMDYKKENDGIVMYYEEHYDYQTYECRICFIPWETNMISMMKDMEELDDLVSFTLQEKWKKEQEEMKIQEAKEKEENERKQYELYLELKAKYEGTKEAEEETKEEVQEEEDDKDLDM